MVASWRMSTGRSAMRYWLAGMQVPEELVIDADTSTDAEPDSTKGSNKADQTKHTTAEPDCVTRDATTAGGVKKHTAQSTMVQRHQDTIVEPEAIEDQAKYTIAEPDRV